METLDERAPEDVLLAFYGDDFTGSTDSMEALCLNGVDTVLFFDPPDARMLGRFPGLRCFGIAGVSRSLPIGEMEKELTPAFEAMNACHPKIVHYKICSTFDSSPEIGSIGHAIALARRILPHQSYVPLLVGAPSLRRYTVFGHHFAADASAVYRLDKHPTMSRHPKTPMLEADLRIHLGRQIEARIDLMSLLDLEGEFEEVERRFREKLTGQCDIVLFDVLHSESLEKAGRLIWDQGRETTRFVVGSSGVEYALVEAWDKEGMIDRRGVLPDPPGPAKQILVLSGSCAPATQRQILWAVDHGFEGVRVPVEALLDEETGEQTFIRLVEQALSLIGQGRSLVLYTALGPEDDGLVGVQQALLRTGQDVSGTGEQIGRRLGRLARVLINETGLRRIVIAGGDTSGYAAREMGIYGMQVLSPIAPGGPLCTAFSEDPRFDGLQIVLKGGQVGGQDYFERVLNGQRG